MLKKWFKNQQIGIFLIFLMVSCFAINIFVGQDEKIGADNFENFQTFSEYLVISKIYNEKYMGHSSYGLTAVLNQDGSRVAKLADQLDDGGGVTNNLTYIPYKSQVGLQGHIFSFLNQYLHIPLMILKLFLCIALAVVLVKICEIISKKYSKLLGVVFYGTFLLSPWIVAYARNLYWVEFTWFLPALFALKFAENEKKRYVVLIFLSILGKCLCGYEFITTVMMFTISFLIADLFMAKKEERKKILKNILIIGCICLLAFFTALTIHSYMRGNGNILEGIKEIYQMDITRRTLSIPGSEQYSNEYVQASIFATIKKYFSWKTNIILGVDGNLFRFICILSFIILLYRYQKKEKDHKRDSILFIVFFFTTLSWFILGKSHAYEHPHLNFVLWYFGFVQMCFYILLKKLLEFFEVKKLKKLDEPM